MALSSNVLPFFPLKEGYMLNVLNFICLAGTIVFISVSALYDKFEDHVD